MVAITTEYVYVVLCEGGVVGVYRNEQVAWHWAGAHESTVGRACSVLEATLDQTPSWP